MRLGTLARKINITPSALTNFLTKEEISLASGTNTKLSDEHIDLVLKHFKKSIPEDPIVEEVIVVEPTDVVDEHEIEPVEITIPLISKKEIESKEDLESTDLVELTPAEPTEIIEKETDSETQELEVETEGNLKVEEKGEGIAEIQNSDHAQIEEPVISDSFAEMALPHELDENTNEVVLEESEQKVTKTEESVEDAPSIEETVVDTEESEKPPLDIDPEIESEVERLAYDDSIKIIKPKKIELQGLTVKGKIDLPTPKPKEEKVVEPPKKAYDPNEIITTSGPSKPRRKPKNYKGKKYDKGYNPVEAAKKKKDWEEKKKKEAEEKKRKAQKAAHYSQKTQKAKSVVEPKKKAKKASKKKQQKKVVEGNVFQKFWRWMNT